ncbi:MAG: hypothetical protein WD737_06705 [Gemmatimonadota bacterium]
MEIWELVVLVTLVGIVLANCIVLLAVVAAAGTAAGTVLLLRRMNPRPGRGGAADHPATPPRAAANIVIYEERCRQVREPALY